jgi:hypothetical protein
MMLSKLCAGLLVLVSIIVMAAVGMLILVDYGCCSFGHHRDQHRHEPVNGLAATPGIGF